MKLLKYNKISKSDFLKLNEDDLLFITNPGRYILNKWKIKKKK